MSENMETHRLAQSAHVIALEAKHLAEKAQMSCSAHEQICIERYTNINAQLLDVKKQQHQNAAETKSAVDKIYVILDQVRKVVNQASALDVFLRYIFLFIGAAGAIYGILK